MLYNFRRLNETNNTKIVFPVNTTHATVKETRSVTMNIFRKKKFFLNHF